MVFGRKLPRHIQQGRLYIRANGEIEINVDDDYYNGVFEPEVTRKLFLVLKSIFEPEQPATADQSTTAGLTQLRDAPPLHPDFRATCVIAESVEELFKGDPYAAEYIQSYMGALSKKLL